MSDGRRDQAIQEADVGGSEPCSHEVAAPDLPESYSIGDDIDWGAPWVDVRLWVELPFWLMVDNCAVAVELNEHRFAIGIYDNYFELHVGMLADSGENVVYMRPAKKLDDLSDDLQQLRRREPEAPFTWRKCKTVLKISSRCNDDVWRKASPPPRPTSVPVYLAELCRAHIPVVNKLVQNYRLATYDYFPFEISPWDLSRWMIEGDGALAKASLVPYRGWDIKPPVIHEEGAAPVPYQLIECSELVASIDAVETPGELELLDALNLMERGDYSGAVRRVTTAIEVVGEAVVESEVEKAEGKTAAAKFVKATRMRFPSRISKYEQLTSRKFPAALDKELKRTRELRHRIVHAGYRITSGEREDAQRSVDTGRWIFNWFENDPSRQKTREKRIAFRSLGRDAMYGIFKSEITRDGVVVGR